MPLSISDRLNRYFCDCLHDLWQSDIDEWDENHITFSLMRKFNDFSIRKLDKIAFPPSIVSFKKLKGKQETAFGDILIRVRFHISQDQIIDGFAFYEAKKQYFTDEEKKKHSGFKELNLSQLERIGLNTSASNLLFYDVLEMSHENFTSIVKNNWFVKLQSHDNLMSVGKIISMYKDEYFAVCMCTPIEVAKGYISSSGRGKSDRGILKYSSPWSESLLNNLKGMGLDFDLHNNKSVGDNLGNAFKPSFVIQSDIVVGEYSEKDLLGSSDQAYEHLYSFNTDNQSHETKPTP